MAPTTRSGGRASLPRQAKAKVQSYAGQDGPAHCVTKKRAKTATTTIPAPVPAPARQAQPRARRGGPRPAPQPAVSDPPAQLAAPVLVKVPAAPLPELPSCGWCGDSSAQTVFATAEEVPRKCRGHLLESICRSCIKRHARRYITHGQLPYCAVCDRQWEYEDAARLLSAPEMEHFESRLFNRMIETDPTFRWCAQDTCLAGQFYYTDLVENDPKICCALCEKTNCFNCRSGWHEGMTCEAYQNPVKREESMQMDEKKTLVTMRKAITKKCPTCGAGARRSYGCNHMVCANCNVSFNWDTAAAV
ncbi:Hypothetical protein D9617_11g009270 [Elsinoe fawcettii]|nr:Hypothetical protein D9617_11g009270 [Elsinoe fawcettii]